MNIPERHENVFAKCPKCNRPYKKGKNYPDEICSICSQEAE